MRRLISAIAIMATMATTVLAQSQTHERFNDLRQRIDSAKELPAEHKERLHAAVNTAESEAAIIDEATEKILELTIGGPAATDPARRAEIEAAIKAQLARIGGAHLRLGALRHEFEADVEASTSLSAAQKTALLTVFREFEQKRITRKEAEESVNQLLGDTDSDSLVLVLFILIVICVPSHC